MSRTKWHDHDWQLIHTEPQSPAMHMALDEVLTSEVSAGRRAPTLRVWEWADPAVVIGRFQSLRNEVDAEAAARIGSQLETGTVFMNRCDYIDPALCWTGTKDTGRGAALSTLGFHSVTRPKSFHLKKVTA